MTISTNLSFFLSIFTLFFFSSFYPFFYLPSINIFFLFFTHSLSVPSFLFSGFSHQLSFSLLLNFYPLSYNVSNFSFCKPFSFPTIPSLTIFPLSIFTSLFSLFFFLPFHYFCSFFFLFPPN